MRPKKREPRKKYESSHPEYGTAEQRLSSAVAQEGDVGALLTLMEYMSPKSGASIYDSPGPQARAYQGDSDVMFIQRAGEEEEGQYSDRGRRLTTQDIESVTGYSGDVQPKHRKLMNSMLQNPDILRYFMDVYSEGSDDFAKVRTYRQRGGSSASSYGTGRGVSKPDASCMGGQCWQN